MNLVRPELRLVRESLEAVVSPSIVSTVMFEALEQTGGELPDGPEAVRQLVEGPLRAALARKVGADAHAMIDDVLVVLATIAPSADASARGRRGPDVTREVFIDGRPVFVVVVSGTSEFASRLSAVLGPTLLTAIPASTMEQLEEHLSIAAPQIVLVDAADFASIEPERLGVVLGKLPATTVRAIWGVDLPYGASILRALVERGAPATPLDRREGIEPLLDLIRSRRSGG